MNHIPHHELARAARAQRLGLPADPAALAALLEQGGLLRDVALDEVTEERDTLKECLALADVALDEVTEERDVLKESLALADVAALAADAALVRATRRLAELRWTLDEKRLARAQLRKLADLIDEELEALDVQLSEVRNQTTG